MIYLEDTIFSWRPRFIITWFTTAKSFWRWRLLLALGASGARSSPNYLRVGMDSGSATPNDAAEVRGTTPGTLRRWDVGGLSFVVRPRDGLRSQTRV